MRRLARLTVEQAADLNGVSARTIESWEDSRNLAKIAKVLAVFESYGCVVKILPPRTSCGVYAPRVERYTKRVPLR